MKIERTWFEGADPNCKAEKIADGESHFDYFPDGHMEIFIPTDGGPNGHVITLTREEAGRPH
jgi:hypothetical protein